VGAGKTGPQLNVLVVVVHARSRRHLVRVLGDETAEVASHRQDVGGVVVDVDVPDELVAGCRQPGWMVEDIDFTHCPEVALWLEGGLGHHTAAVGHRTAAGLPVVPRVTGAGEVVVAVDTSPSVLTRLNRAIIVIAVTDRPEPAFTAETHNPSFLVQRARAAIVARVRLAQPFTGLAKEARPSGVALALEVADTLPSCHFDN